MFPVIDPLHEQHLTAFRFGHVPQAVPMLLSPGHLTFLPTSAPVLRPHPHVDQRSSFKALMSFERASCTHHARTKTKKRSYLYLNVSTLCSVTEPSAGLNNLVHERQTEHVAVVLDHLRGCTNHGAYSIPRAECAATVRVRLRRRTYVLLCLLAGEICLLTAPLLRQYCISQQLQQGKRELRRPV